MKDDIWHTDGGVYFGYGSNILEGPAPKFTANLELSYTNDRHLITIGPNGSGKSRRLLVPNLARLTGWSIVVIDPKGELAAMTAEHRRRAGNRVIIVNPFNVLELGSDGFNPVAALNPQDDEFPDDALGLAEAMIRVQGKEPHWAESAQDLIAALLMYSRLVDEQGGSLGEVRKNLGLSQDEFVGLIAKIMLTARLENIEELGTKIGRYADISPENREIQSILSTALTQTRWLDSRPVKKDLLKPPFDASKLKEQPTTIYLTLPARRLGTHSTWLRLMISSILQPLMKDTRKSKVPVLFMLDEFAQLGHLPVIENNLALMRGYGIKLWTVFQDMAQGMDIYGDRWESFIGNAGVLHSFAPQDTTTAEYLSKRAGQKSKDVVSTSYSRAVKGQEIGAESVAVNPTGLPTLLAQDVRNMDPGYAIIFTHTAKGTIRSFAPYPDQLPHLRDICRLDPSALSV